jgi:hypothetical protein
VGALVGGMNESKKKTEWAACSVVVDIACKMHLSYAVVVVVGVVVVVASSIDQCFFQKPRSEYVVVL